MTTAPPATETLRAYVVTFRAARKLVTYTRFALSVSAALASAECVAAEESMPGRPWKVVSAEVSP